MSDVTCLLNAIQQGDPKAAEELLPLVYQKLRQLTAAKMARDNPGHTLQPTALVHEAWLRLGGGDGVAQFANRAHFFAAAEAMRRILVDRARRRQAIRHGGGQERVELEAVELPMPVNDDTLVRVSEALDELAKLDATEAEVVKLRFFVGLKQPEIASALARLREDRPAPLDACEGVALHADQARGQRRITPAAHSSFSLSS